LKDLFAAVSRIDLGARPTPMEEHVVDGVRMLVLRDDRIGGNKVRSLEFLLSGGPRRLLTYSTLSAHHALATTRAGARLGIETDVVLVKWGRRGEVYEAVKSEAARVREVGGALGAVWKTLCLWRPGTRIIPPGGMSAAGALGYAAAVVEWERIPRRIYLPHGTGTTTSGILCGLMLRGAECEVVAVNVTGHTGGEWRRAQHAARLLGRRVERGGVTLRIEKADGAYGEETAESRRARELADFPVDPTYGAKALAVLLRERPDDALFLVTACAAGTGDSPAPARS
jgi:1-aminocyclopropane-1-carboxylate deaminase/D-cysteine desulfhydrase-like pyridoxal-dependent ACC family enzyme